MQTVTFQLPNILVQRAKQIALVLGAPLEEVLSSALSVGLPDLQDIPAEMQLELAQMTGLSDNSLWAISKQRLSDEQQSELSRLVMLQGERSLLPDEQIQLEELRQEYGRITLRKSQAYALLSLRGGRPLLEQVK